MLENFPTYIKNVMEEDPYSILNELTKKGNIINQKAVLHFLRT